MIVLSIYQTVHMFSDSAQTRDGHVVRSVLTLSDERSVQAIYDKTYMRSQAAFLIGAVLFDKIIFSLDFIQIRIYNN